MGLLVEQRAILDPVRLDRATNVARERSALARVPEVRRRGVCTRTQTAARVKDINKRGREKKNP